MKDVMTAWYLGPEVSSGREPRGSFHTVKVQRLIQVHTMMIYSSIKCQKGNLKTPLSWEAEDHHTELY